MKQAILITAYKNFHHLEEIINFYQGKFSIYVHIDRKSKIALSELDHLKNLRGVKMIAMKYKVNWGSLNHLKAILFLAERALRDKDNFYFHLISGHDFPIRRRKEFEDFFIENNKNEYLEYFDVPRPGWANNGGMDRLSYYNFFDFLDWKKPRQRKLIKFIVEKQKKYGLKRTLPEKMPRLYGGSTWWSLSRGCLDYVVSYTNEHPTIFNRFRYTFCAEEFYFPTVILNSPFRSAVINDNLRHIDWIARNGNNPAILDATDYPLLMEKGNFFARKFEYPQSIILLNKIKEILNE